MIVEYHRPETISEALALLARKDPLTLPLGGGTTLANRHKPDFAVVDLQRLGLNTIQREGQLLHLGSMVTLQAIYECEEFPPAIRAALNASLEIEAGLNRRQAATLGGAIVSCDGRSPFVTALLALDPRLSWAPRRDVQPLGDYLPLREEYGRGEILLDVRIPLNASLQFESVGRAPLDLPIVCAAVATWPSGRTRVALGGHGPAPELAMDGPEPGGAAMAAREAYRFTDDEWASAAYRMETAAKLVQRMAQKGKA